MGWFLESQMSRNVKLILDNQNKFHAKTVMLLEEILVQQASLLAQQADLLVRQKSLEENINSITDAVYDLLLQSGPGPIFISVTGESENQMIIFNISLPPKSAPDVVSRKLSVVINDGAPEEFELGADELSKDGLKGPQDANVVVSLVDVDDAGNESPSSTASGTLVDTFAPPQPGELGIAVVGEE